MYMNKPYTYIITDRHTGEFYIGSRSANRTQASLDLWCVYFTSSKLVNERVKSKGKDCFDAQVIDEFETPEEAFIAEQKLISNNISNPLCLNKTFQLNGKRVFLTTGTKRTNSPEARKKISEALKGRPSYIRTEKHLAILSENGKKTGGRNKGIPASPETRKKISEANKGRPGPNKGNSFSGEALTNIQEAARRPERRAKLSQALKGRTSPTKGMTFDYKPMSKADCPHCGKQFGVNNVKQHIRRCSQD